MFVALDNTIETLLQDLAALQAEEECCKNEIKKLESKRAKQDDFQNLVELQTEKNLEEEEAK